MAEIVLSAVIGDKSAQVVNFFAVRNLLIMREAHQRDGLTLSSESVAEGSFIVISGEAEKVCNLLKDLYYLYGITNLNVTPQTTEEDEFICKAMDDDFWTCQLSEPEVENATE